MIFSQDPVANSTPLSHLNDRRGVLGLLGMAGVGLVVSSTSAGASTLLKGAAQPKITVGASSGPVVVAGNSLDLSHLPQEWITIQGALIPQYTRYLASLKLKRISAVQVIEAHAKEKGGVWNNLPPKQWWTRMGYTLRVVDRIAQELNSPVEEIVSAYRCPRYNAHCEGAKTGSWHQANVAVDVRFPMSPRRVTAVSRNLRDRGLFKGGVGNYPGFTHVDTRGTNINW